MASSESTPLPPSDAAKYDNVKKAFDKAVRGGVSGAMAMSINVLALMWLRTTINYQYRFGTNMRTALTTLYKEGGVVRFYRGLAPALLQGPLSRFGDTAANSGVLAFLDANETTRDLPVGLKTVAASTTAALWRIFLMPIDTCKTIMQVEGKNGMPALGAKLKANGPTVLYHGAIAASVATFVGHYPWFFTFNYLNEVIPRQKELGMKLLRNAGIGFVSTVVSDCCSNSIRVLKVYRQASTTPVSYLQSAKNVIATDGFAGLFGRGLSTKIVANGFQGLLFSVLWKAIEEQMNKH